ncbi:MAG: hydrogenase formation protein HypD [Candidatus Omnitrophica bacterium]|nr:hydrogenase formation protein HypD [Candidatus Omnitrophota bacterium]
MKFLSEYRHQREAENLYSLISVAANNLPLVSLMEVCGTHTMAIGRAGLRKRLPENVRLISGPGCPVCVTPDGYLDEAITLVEKEEVNLCTFGDMMRVPGSRGTLEQSQSKGNKVFVVYSPTEALELAGKTKGEVVFLAVGFETTAPAVAWVVKKASQEKIRNFSLLVGHKLIPPAMAALLEDARMKIDGFICPGHVSAIIGKQPYQFIAERYRRACVIAGFETLDIVQAILMLLQQLKEKRSAVEIQYSRCVQPEGNRKAWELIREVFSVVETEWRGLGIIPQSGLALNKKYAWLDARKRFSLSGISIRKREKCKCGEILKGLISPLECPLFGQKCTPSHPVGPCMVSSEGTCAAYYQYEVEVGDRHD